MTTYAVELITGKFAAAGTAATEAMASASEYMSTLDKFLSELSIQESTIDEIEFPEILPIDFSTRPEFTSELATFSAFSQDMPGMEELLDTSKYTAPYRPSLVEVTDPGGMVYDPGAYNSDIRADLFAKLLSDIRNGGTGLTPAVEAEIYARGLERQRIENERLYNATESKFTASGFELPGGAIAAALQEVTVDISGKNDQLSREITINQAELEQKNTQFIIEKAVQVEEILLKAYNDQENRLFEAAKAIAQSTIEAYNMIIANQALKLEGYKTDAEVFKIKVDSATSSNEIILRKYETEVKTILAQIDAEVKAAQIQVEEFKAEASIYEVETKATGVQYEAQMTQSELLIKKVSAQIAQQIAVIESSTSSFTALKSLQERGLESIMNVSAQLAASAMNSVNASASLGQSSSTSTSYSYT